MFLSFKLDLGKIGRVAALTNSRHGMGTSAVLQPLGFIRFVLWRHMQRDDATTRRMHPLARLGLWPGLTNCRLFGPHPATLLAAEKPWGLKRCLAAGLRASQQRFGAALAARARKARRDVGLTARDGFLPPVTVVAPRQNRPTMTLFYLPGKNLRPIAWERSDSKSLAAAIRNAPKPALLHQQQCRQNLIIFN